MKKMFLADWRCHKGELVILPLMILGIYAMGIAFLLAVIHFDNADYIPFATMLALFMLLQYAIMVGQQFANGWRLAGAMGASRKDYCGYMILRQLVISAIGYGMILVLRFLEDGLVQGVFGAVPNILDLSCIYRPGIAAAILCGSLIYQLVIAALAIRLGQQGAVWCYLITMMVFLFGSRFHGLISYISALSLGVLLLGAGILAAACLIFIFRTFRTMSVK